MSTAHEFRLHLPRGYKRPKFDLVQDDNGQELISPPMRPTEFLEAVGIRDLEEDRGVRSGDLETEFPWKSGLFRVRCFLQNFDIYQEKHIYEGLSRYSERDSDLMLIAFETDGKVQNVVKMLNKPYFDLDVAVFAVLEDGQISPRTELARLLATFGASILTNFRPVEPMVREQFFGLARNHLQAGDLETLNP